MDWGFNISPHYLKKPEPQKLGLLRSDMKTTKEVSKASRLPQTRGADSICFSASGKGHPKDLPP